MLCSLLANLKYCPLSHQVTRPNSRLVVLLNIIHPITTCYVWFLSIETCVNDPILSHSSFCSPKGGLPSQLSRPSSNLSFAIYIFLLFLIQTLTQKLSLLELVPPLEAFQVALVVKKLPANAGDIETWFNSWVKKIPWKRAWQRTPVFLPGEFHGQRSLAGYSPRDHKELDITEQLTHTH